MAQGKKKILVVDDEPNFLELIKIRLEANGYEVVLARDGREALERLEGDPVDAVLLDIMMPKMHGIDVLENIRKKNKTLPVFMITAYSSEENFRRAKALGAAGYIAKTSDLNKEVQDITAILRLSGRYKGQET
ncbi:MAG: response regulator [Candidatus Omnitrophica bacterium]|nr:response regulator [Candidatus Omnitrophota bacterium]